LNRRLDGYLDSSEGRLHPALTEDLSVLK
jgi:hypothetical protein